MPKTEAELVSLDLRIPPRSAYVGVVRLALSSLARTAGMEEETIDDMKIAVSEACANAVIATEAAGTDDPVQITFLEDRHRLVIEIRDRGASRVEDPNEAGDSDIATRTDLSMALIRSLMTDCQIDRTEDGFNLTRLILNREPAQR